MAEARPFHWEFGGEPVEREIFRVEGGRPLTGTVTVSGAKNAALPILAAALLPSGGSTFKNVPELADVRTMAKLLRMLGWDVEAGPHTLAIASPTGKKKPKRVGTISGAVVAGIMFSAAGPTCTRWAHAS